MNVDEWLRDFYDRKRVYLFLAIVLAVGLMSWDVGRQHAEVGDLIGRFDNDHTTRCAQERDRMQTVVNFWSNRSAKISSHAAHETDASRKWAVIVGDLKRTHVGDARLLSDVSTILAKWSQLAADDAENARLGLQYERDIRDDYDSTCHDVAPTPEPTPESTPDF